MDAIALIPPNKLNKIMQPLAIEKLSKNLFL